MDIFNILNLGDLPWLLIALVMVAIFATQKFYLSPTGIFIGYSLLVFPIAYLVSKNLGSPSVFYSAPSEMASESVFFAYLALILGIFAFIFGRYVLPIPYLMWPNLKIMYSRVKWSMLVAICIAIISAIILIENLGGISRILTELGSVRSGELKGSGVQVYAITMLCPTLMQFWLIASIRNRSKYVNLILIGCILTSLMGGFFGFRGPVVALLIQVAAIWYLMTGRPSRKALLFILILTIPFVSILGYVRMLTNETLIDILQTSDRSILYSYIADTALTRVRGVETFVVMKEFVDTADYGFFFNNIAEAMFSFVPSFVVEKGPSISEIIATNVYGEYLFDAGILKEIYGGVSYTYLSEAYWNLGFCGIALFCFMIGIIFRIVEGKNKDGVCPSNIQIVFYKAIAGFTLLTVEAPQLGINAIVTNVFVNMVLLFLLSLRFFPVVIVNHNKV